MDNDQPHAGGRRRRIGDILVDDGILSPSQLERALEAQRSDDTRTRLGRTVIELGFVSEHAVTRALARQLGLRTVDLSVTTPDDDAITLVPQRVTERLGVLPLELDTDEDRLVVAVSDPTDVLALDDLRAHTGVRHLDVLVATETSIEHARRLAYDASSSATRLVEQLGGTVDIESVQVETAEPEVDAVRDEPVIALVNALLGDAVRSRTSDVHVEPERHHVRVRYRIDGLLRDAQHIPKAMGPAVTSRLKIMSSLDISERRRPQDGRAVVRVGGEEVDLRVSTMPTLHGEVVVLRLLRKGSERPTIDVLGLDRRQRQMFATALAAPQGLVLLTGPTGSGKTTSLYAGLAEIVSTELNVVTLEDPVEYQMDGVNQTQMNPKAGLTFATGLRTVLRQDPDVVLVGEIRDDETAQLAVAASFTGHLVLSTLHTNDAPSTVARLVELGVERFLLATTLSVVVAQRLGRRICTECRTDAPPPEDDTLRLLGLDRSAIEAHPLYRGAGCAACGETGYLGRIGFYEMLEMTPRMRQLISDGGNELQIGALGRAQGMRSLREDALRKALDGVTTLDEVLRTTPDDQFRTDRSAVLTRDEPAHALAERVGALVTRRALVVADEHVAGAMAGALPEGWAPDVATDAAAAAAAARSRPPDVVVVAGSVAGERGVEVAARLRAVVAQDVHVVLRSDEPLSPTQRTQATVAGVDDVLDPRDGPLSALRDLLDAVLPAA